MLVFEEAKSCYIYGQAVATILLAAAFAEHWLGALLARRGYTKQAKAGLRSIVKHCREQRLAPEVILNKVDRLRQIRNPFVHLKGFDHEHGIAQRTLKARTNPFELVDADAREAIVAMYAVAHHSQAQA
jgi:hypothetical protein